MNKNLFNQTIKYALPLFLQFFIIGFLYQADILFAEGFNKEALDVIFPESIISLFVIFILNSIYISFQVSLSYYIGNSNNEKINEIMEFMKKVRVGLFIFVFLILIFSSHIVNLLIQNPLDYKESLLYFRIITLSYFFLIYTYDSNVKFRCFEIVNKATMISLFCASLNMILNFLFINKFGINVIAFNVLITRMIEVFLSERYLEKLNFPFKGIKYKNSEVINGIKKTMSLLITSSSLEIIITYIFLVKLYSLNENVLLFTETALVLVQISFIFNNLLITMVDVMIGKLFARFDVNHIKLELKYFIIFSLICSIVGIVLNFIAYFMFKEALHSNIDTNLIFEFTLIFSLFLFPKFLGIIFKELLRCLNYNRIYMYIDIFSFIVTFLIIIIFNYTYLELIFIFFICMYFIKTIVTLLFLYKKHYI
ncbi:MAG: MATE family efflux transporter [Bacilli bacterium]